MANQQLTDFVAKAKTEGKTDEQIRAALINAKWPENDINEALGGASPASSTAGAAVPPPAAGQPAASQSDLFTFDQKTIETMKWSAIWNAVAGAITSLVASVSAYFFFQNAIMGLGVIGGMMGSASLGGSFINISGLVMAVVYGAIFGGIGGFILAKFYEPIMGFQAKILANKLNTLFKLLFWPQVIGAAIGALLGLGAVAFLGLTGLAINFIGSVAAYFIYAKMMEKNVGQYYPSR
ncbi:MAG: hypothetical protein HZA37_01145 [Parcubacteria group bacterium]|nr:hypothetical protein [Parcubacteria group bacterium]